MALPNTFAAQLICTGAALDANFTAVSQQGVISCTATGTANAILLAQTGNAVEVTVLGSNMVFAFIAAHTNSGSTTVNLNSLGAAPIYKNSASGAQLLTGGEIVSGAPIMLAYDAVSSVYRLVFLPFSGFTPPSGIGLFAWGANAQGQLGVGNNAYYSSPVQVGSSELWTDVSCGNFFAAGINGGNLFAWGSPVNVPSTGFPPASSSPVQIGSASNWTQISASLSFANVYLMGIAGGALFTMGANSYGQLGNGSITPSSLPVQIGAATNWTAVSAGGGHCLGISGGALFAWGANAFGQIGNGTTTYYSSPVQIGALTTWTAVAAGYNFSFGIAGGALFAWGNNNFGQLGTGNTTSVSSPVQVGALTSWTVVAASTFSSFGISTGRLYAWGENNYYQLGLATSTKFYSSPVQVGSASNWTAIAPSTQFACGIAGGELFSWGRNNQGQCGQGYVSATISSPVLVGALTSWTACGAGQGENVGMFAMGIN
jgi:alpha-tubulin suppressor-like RCC1 family protein